MRIKRIARYYKTRCRRLVPGVQTGEGYLTYKALSALAYELQKLYIQLDYISRQSHADTADLDELVEIAKDRGIYQKKATSAYVSVKGNTVIPIGTRFSLKSFNYRIVEAINENTYTYKAACEETGTGPNNLTGELIANRSCGWTGKSGDNGGAYQWRGG